MARACNVGQILNFRVQTIFGATTTRWSTTMNFDKKDEDTGALFHLDKTQVFQDARAFNASPIQPKKCRVILTKIKCTRRDSAFPFFASNANPWTRSVGQW
jgi:hypothetical protein